MEEAKVKETVWETVQALNRLWTVENNPDELRNYFHKDMVAITPTDHYQINSLHIPNSRGGVYAPLSFYGLCHSIGSLSLALRRGYGLRRQEHAL